MREQTQADLSPGIRGCDGFYVATITTDCPTNLTEANANLIAAAPDLLAACEAAFIAFMGLREIHGPQRNAITLLDVAIAKAKGEQP